MSKITTEEPASAIELPELGREPSENEAAEARRQWQDAHPLPPLADLGRFAAAGLADEPLMPDDARQMVQRVNDARRAAIEARQSLAAFETRHTLWLLARTDDQARGEAALSGGAFDDAASFEAVAVAQRRGLHGRAVEATRTAVAAEHAAGIALGRIDLTGPLAEQATDALADLDRAATDHNAAMARVRDLAARGTNALRALDWRRDDLPTSAAPVGDAAARLSDAAAHARSVAVEHFATLGTATP